MKTEWRTFYRLGLYVLLGRRAEAVSETHGELAVELRRVIQDKDTRPGSAGSLISSSAILIAHRRAQ